MAQERLEDILVQTRLRPLCHLKRQRGPLVLASGDHQLGVLRSECFMGVVGILGLLIREVSV
jgi:hypothetical protein